MTQKKFEERLLKWLERSTSCDKTSSEEEKNQVFVYPLILSTLVISNETLTMLEEDLVELKSTEMAAKRSTVVERRKNLPRKQEGKANFNRC